VAPTDSLPIVRYNEKAGSRSLDMMRWGLVPYWAKDLKIGFSTINAIAETVDTKPVYREAFRRRRCLVPVNNFYEWKKLDQKTKQPYAIGLKDGGLMALAGLWGNWRSPAEEWVRSFTVIACPPNPLCAEVHDRLPVILAPDAWPVWLGEKTADSERLKGLLTPYPAGGMTMWPVSKAVGNVKNQGRELAERIMA